MKKLAVFGVWLLAAIAPAAPVMECDVLIRNGLICDGSGDPPRRGDLAIQGDKILAVGGAEAFQGRQVIEAEGLVLAPGFINVLSWATETLLVDGRSQSDIRQGVTLEIFGEGESMGPLNPRMKEEMRTRQGDLKFEVAWTTLDEYLQHLVDRGVSPNVASFVGATTVRVHELGYEDRPPTPKELDRMCQLVHQAMAEGALGLGASLIYAPAFYGRYVREEQLVPIEEAIRRMSSLPAETLKLDRRGRLRKGFYADVVVFDAEKIQDHASYDKPHQYATGVQHVFVNGVQVLKDGQHTGATPGRVVRGPGYSGKHR